MHCNFTFSVPQFLSIFKQLQFWSLGSVEREPELINLISNNVSAAVSILRFGWLVISPKPSGYLID